MNKKLVYVIIAALFLGATAFVVLRSKGGLQNKAVAFYPFKERKGQLAQAMEWASAKEKAEKLIRMVRENPDDTKSAIGLATLYIQEGRATGDFTYYDEAAMHYIDEALKAEPRNFEALVLKSVVQLSQHHFTDGLQTAQQAKDINPYNAYVYGLITDGNVETGNYPAAVESCDKMVSIRPDLRSYSRISYLREIHGDLPGAIDAMNEAVKAGFPGEESTEWARVQLAHLYEATGALKAAEMHYTIALRERPGYAHAVAGLGNVAVANRDYEKALSFYQQADTLLSDYSFKEKEAEVYLLTGQKEKADKVLDNIVSTLTAAAAQGEAGAGHHVDKELAYVYLLKGQPGKAVDRAEAEYKRRPKNNDVNEAVAWALAADNDAVKALPYLTAALSTGCKNPTLLCRAGLIYNKAGDKQKAKQFLAKGLEKNPGVDPLLLQESRAVLKAL